MERSTVIMILSRAAGLECSTVNLSVEISLPDKAVNICLNCLFMVAAYVTRWHTSTLRDVCLAVRHTVVVEFSWNVMAHGNARDGKWRGNWRMEWVASTLHTTSEHGVSSITTADAQTSAASSRLNWRPRRFKWIRPFRRKTKSGFCACAITFQTQST